MPVKRTLALCLLVACPWGFADGTTANEEMPNIIVSATRTPQTREFTPLSIEVITRAEIVRMGAPHVADLLRAIGTAQVEDDYGDGSRATIGMRGFGATAGANTLILIDGRRLNNSDLAPPDLGTISLRDVERVEVIKGSSAVLFGDQAVGGVVNIITQTPAAPRVEFAAGVGSLGTRSLQAIVDQPLGDALNLRVSAETRHADGFRDRNELDLTDLHGNLQYHADGTKAFLELHRARELLELPGALTHQEVVQDATRAQHPADFANTTTETARIGIDRPLLPELALIAEATWRKSDAQGALSGGTRFDQQRRSQSFNPRVEISAADALITTGADVESTHYRLTSWFGGFPATTRSEQEIGAAYFQAVYPLDHVVNATLGARVARMRNSIDDAYAGRIRIDDTARALELGVNWRPTERLRLHARDATSYRFPKTDELTFTGIATSTLATQTGRSLEAGVAWQSAALDLDASVYRLALRHEIGFDPLADIGFGFFGANNNLDDTLRKGISISADWRPSERLSFSTGLDLVDARFTEGAFRSRDIPFVSDRLFHAAATIVPAPGWSLYLEARYTGPRFADGDFDNGLDRQGGYTVWNAHVGYQGRHWTLGLRADNLGNMEYSEYVALRWDGVKTYYPLPGRRYHLQFGYRF